jgi:hypothetical protein
MVLTPRNTTWRRLEKSIIAEPSMYDMDIVNKELREDIVRISSRYAMLNSLFEDKTPEPFYGTTFEELYNTAFYFHFTAVGKPWNVRHSTVEQRVRAGRAQPQMVRLFDYWDGQLQQSYNTSMWSFK